MQPGQTADPLTWTLDEDGVDRVWSETRQVLHNKLWYDSMYGVIPHGWQAELERRSGRSFGDVLRAVQAVDGLDRDHPDPSLVFLGLHREFARYGVTLRFAPHRLHGDVLNRAQQIEVGTPPAEQDGWDLDTEDVVTLWDLAAEGIEYGSDASDDSARDLAEMLPSDILDAYERRVGEARIALSDLFEDVDEDTSPREVLLHLQRLLAKDGVVVRFAPHPEHGHIQTP